LTNISDIETLFKVRFIQDTGINRFHCTVHPLLAWQSKRFCGRFHFDKCHRNKKWLLTLSFRWSLDFTIERLARMNFKIGSTDTESFSRALKNWHLHSYLLKYIVRKFFLCSFQFVSNIPLYVNISWSNFYSLPFLVFYSVIN
jgi:hypothetical protein